MRLGGAKEYLQSLEMLLAVIVKEARVRCWISVWQAAWSASILSELGKVTSILL